MGAGSISTGEKSTHVAIEYGDNYVHPVGHHPFDCVFTLWQSQHPKPHHRMTCKSWRMGPFSMADPVPEVG
ncbi:hypothetical protein V2G26_009666 [Clonostachys chloroleuca]